MQPATPHFAFPLVFRGASLATVEQGSDEHALGCAEVLLRTQRGMFDHDVDLGLMDLAGSEDAPDRLIAEALASQLDSRAFTATETETTAELVQRIRRVRVELVAREDGGG